MSLLLALLAISATPKSITYTLTDLGANALAYSINNATTPTIVGYDTSSTDQGCYWYNGGSETKVSSVLSFRSVNDNNIAVGTVPGTPDQACTYTIPGGVLTTYATSNPGNGPMFGYGIDNQSPPYITGWDVSYQRMFYYKTGTGATEYLLSAVNPSSIQTGAADGGGDGPMGNNIFYSSTTDYITGKELNSVPGYTSYDGFFVDPVSGNYTVSNAKGSTTGVGTAIDSQLNCASQRPNGSNTNAYFYSGGTFTLIGSATQNTTASGIAYATVNGTTADMVVGSFGSHAYVWTSAGGQVDLNSVTTNLPASWVLNVARAINNSGCIVGYATVTSGGTHTTHGFLLTP